MSGLHLWRPHSCAHQALTPPQKGIKTAHQKLDHSTVYLNCFPERPALVFPLSPSPPQVVALAASWSPIKPGYTLIQLVLIRHDGDICVDRELVLENI